MQELPSQKDQDLILICIGYLPPHYLKRYCNTDDRKQHFEDLKIHFNILLLALKSYFSDQPSLMDLVPIELYKPLVLQRDRYMKMYTMLFDGWKYIQKAAIDYQFPILNTPGEMLIQIIENECNELFLMAFPEYWTGNSYVEYSPRKDYNFNLENSHVLQLISKVKPLSKCEENRVSIHQKELQKQKRANEEFSPRNFSVLAPAMKQQNTIEL